MPYQILGGARTPIKVFVPDLAQVESQALDQLRNTANLPWVHAVAAMPDVHLGNGATVGSVIVQSGALSPAVVGVDIGCGMIAVRTPLAPDQLEGDEGLRRLRASIERSVPVGFNSNSKISGSAQCALLELGRPSERASDALYTRATQQLGSLGGGNHFIEVCLDLGDNVWVVLHSGSRNIGKELAERHIRAAKGLMGDLVRRFGEMQIDPELAALAEDTPEYQAYIEDLFWCQRFAAANRREMMVRVLKDLSYHAYGEDKGAAFMTMQRIECHHNYVEDTTWDGRPVLITRKGAVSAREGELGIIPGSMGQKSYIVRGKGNPDSFCSCSHGAGRRMSRGAAKRNFTVADLEAQTAGVECRKDAGVLDEIPGAYKDIDVVMENQRELIDIVAELKQVICVKG